MSELTFIHAADLHLDSLFKGLSNLPDSIRERVFESTFRAFDKLIQSAIQREVDFVLLSGDLYDESNRSLKAQVKLREQFVKLHDHHIKVFIIHGNHDHLKGKWTTITWPPNVYFFSDEVDFVTYEKNNTVLAHIYGFSYPTRNVPQKMIYHYKKIDGAKYHIGMLHGSVQGSKEHDVYAPFTVQELLEKDFDYWALGHIHKREHLHENPPIIYPGNLQGRHKKETDIKGAYLVSMSPNKTMTEFIPTSDIIWESTNLYINEIKTVDELLFSLKTLKEKIRKEAQPVMLNVCFTGTGPLYQYLANELNILEVIEIVFAEEEYNDNFVWLVDWKNDTSPHWNRDSLINEEHFVSDLLKQVDLFENYDEVLSPLFNHRLARKFLEELNEDEQNEVLKHAETFLLNGLLRNEQ